MIYEIFHDLNSLLTTVWKTSKKIFHFFLSSHEAASGCSSFIIELSVSRISVDFSLLVTKLIPHHDGDLWKQILFMFLAFWRLIVRSHVMNSKDKQPSKVSPCFALFLSFVSQFTTCYVNAHHMNSFYIILFFLTHPNRSL